MIKFITDKINTTARANTLAIYLMMRKKSSVLLPSSKLLSTDCFVNYIYQRMKLQ